MNITYWLEKQFIKLEWLVSYDKDALEHKYVRLVLQHQLDKHRSMLEQMIKDFGWDQVSDDVRMILILRWVNNFITYKTDKIQYKKTEYWADIEELLASKAGDCEDGAMLIFLLGRASGIPADRLWLVAGDVMEGGHCWVRYISESMPYVSFYLDWCYLYDESFLVRRQPFFDYHGKIEGSSTRYRTIWFLSNDGVTVKWQQRRSWVERLLG